MTQDGAQSPGGVMLWLESRAAGLLPSSAGSCSLTSKALSTTEEDVLFNKATASLRLTSVSSVPLTLNKMSPDGQTSRTILSECQQDPSASSTQGQGRGKAEGEACFISPWP